MDAFIKLVGANVKKLRKAQGLSQEKLGERAGCDYRYIGFLEQARINPTLKTLEKVANALKMTVPELFPSNKEIEANKKAVPAKEVEREKILSQIMKNLNKVDNRKLKVVAKIIKISVE